MKPGPVIALCAVCVAAGAALGFALGADYASSPYAESRDPQYVAPVDRRQPASGVPDSPRESTEGAAPGSGAFETAPVPTGAGAIRGLVARRNGLPVPGVSVRAAAFFPRRAQGADVPLHEDVADYARVQHWQAAVAPSAVTDESGAYELTSLPEEAEYELSASMPGFRCDRLPGPRRVRPGSVVNFVAVEAGVVEVVLRAGGGVPPSTKLYCRPLSLPGVSSRGLEWRAPHVEFLLEPGRWSVGADAGRHYVDYSSPPAEIDVSAGSRQRVELDLRGNPGLVVNLVIPPEFPRMACYVMVTRNLTRVFTTGEELGAQIEESNNEPPPRLARAPDLNFRVEPVRPGANRVYAFDLSGSMLVWRDVDIGEGTTACTLEIPAPTRDGFIVLRAIGPDGGALEGVRAALAHVLGSAAYAAKNAYPVIHRDQSLWIPRIPVRAPLEGSDWSWKLTLTHPQHGPETVHYARTDTHDIEVRMQAAAFATILAPDVSPLELRDGLRWSIVPRGAPGLYYRFQRKPPFVDQQGPERIGPLKPGEYDLVLTCVVNHGDVREFSRRVITLAAGENEVAAAWPELYTIIVRVPPDPGARRLHLLSRAPRVASDVSAHRAPLLLRDGVATLEHIAAGDYTLESDVGRADIRVQGNQEFLFEPPRFDAFKLSRLPEGGRLCEMGLRNGDLLVAIDGAEIGWGAAADAAYEASLVKTRTTWTLSREGAQIELVIDGTEIMRLYRATEREYILRTPAYR